jgi:quercetin dioxygenase-like cupin family protein
MNALSRDLPRAPAHKEAMARDLLGFASLAPAAVDYHAMLSSRDTGGPLSLCEATWAAGSGAQAHVHPAEDEVFIVLSGEVELTISGRRFRRGPGEPAFIPRGTEHAFRALTQARVLAILTRQSLEAPLTERVRGTKAPRLAA